MGEFSVNYRGREFYNIHIHIYTLLMYFYIFISLYHYISLYDASGVGKGFYKFLAFESWGIEEMQHLCLYQKVHFSMFQFLIINSDLLFIFAFYMLVCLLVCLSVTKELANDRYMYHEI